MTPAPDRRFEQAVRTHLVDLVDRGEAVPPRRAAAAAAAHHPSRDRLRILTVSVVAVAVVAAGAFAVVASQRHGGDPARPAGPAVTVPAATPTPDPLSCDLLLGAASKASLLADDLVPSGDDYRDKIASEPQSSLAPFLVPGGVVCRWGVELGDVAIVYGAAPISEEKAETARRRLVREGSTPVEDFRYERFTAPGGYPGGYAFGDGYWMYALDNASFTEREGQDLLDELVSNAPGFD